ncbi:hypothetical protein SAMN04490243_2579 [Robiginitalea myxolifaciens]|uniref:DUF4249 family protein n=1 Tax=Robiginitalea myxolifaciens TaxID=400055 RepID=A0A1I6HD08_9FLAO|nr:hypothetical protein [Robiginitalea myxolifaciens]SFR52329.1 hypothetical protein SAMN04490243_2579 [Robiginitalea myxolifaciens]
MKMNTRKLLALCCLASLLLAAFCDPIDEPTDIDLAPKNFRISLTEGPQIGLTDTLWISARASTNYFDRISGDSIEFLENPPADVITIMRLQEAIGQSNTIQAVEEFVIVPETGSIDFLGACPEASVIFGGDLNQGESAFRYRIGLVPSRTGDYMISWDDFIEFRNSDLNYPILANYPIENNPFRVGLESCGIIATIPNVRQRQREFFFSVN